MYNLASKIIKYYGLKNKIKKKEINNSSPQRRVPDITKLKRSTKFSNKFSLDKGLEKTLSWYKKYYQNNSKTNL